jgi:hypothetical protein
MKKAGTHEDKQSEVMPSGTSGTAPSAGVEFPEGHWVMVEAAGVGDLYITALERVAVCARRRVKVWSAISAYSEKEHRQVQRDLTAALKELEGFA